MTLKFNYSDVQNVFFNGTQFEKLQLNGVTVWEHAQPVPGGTVIFEGTTPGTFDVTIPAPGMYVLLYRGWRWRWWSIEYAHNGS